MAGQLRLEGEKHHFVKGFLLRFWPSKMKVEKDKKNIIDLYIGDRSINLK
jgi:hypothetical protein